MAIETYVKVELNTTNCDTVTPYGVVDLCNNDAGNG